MYVSVQRNLHTLLGYVLLYLINNLPWSTVEKTIVNLKTNMAEVTWYGKKCSVCVFCVQHV